MSFSIDFSIQVDYTHIQEEKDWFFFSISYHFWKCYSSLVKILKNISEKSIFVDYETFDRFQF